MCFCIKFTGNVVIGFIPEMGTIVLYLSTHGPSLKSSLLFYQFCRSHRCQNVFTPLFAIALISFLTSFVAAALIITFLKTQYEMYNTDWLNFSKKKQPQLFPLVLGVIGSRSLGVLKA